MEKGWKLYCPRCGYSIENSYRPFCPNCKKPLELEGEVPKPRAPLLGEGKTPVVERSFEKSKVVLKLEYLNPSGSFKDRGSAPSVWLAKKLGYKCVVEDSSGNTGLSVAMYSAYLGLKAHIVVPKGAGKSKKILLKSLGVELIETETRDEAYKIAARMSDTCFYVAHAYSPIFIEGMKTIAYELKDYGDWSFIVPVSSGTLLLGLYKGFKELSLKPRIYAVQASEAASLRGRVKVLAEVGGKTSKLADALVLKNPPRIDSMAKAIASSGGGVIIVGDDAIKSATKELLLMGFIVEPSSAAAWAGFKVLKALGINDDFVIPLTGNGLKYYERLSEITKS